MLSPWQNHLPYSPQKGKSNGNQSPTEKFTPEASLFISNSYCQNTSLNPVSCFPRTLWNENGDFWHRNKSHSAVGGAWQGWLHYLEHPSRERSRWQQGPLQVSNLLVWQLWLVCDSPALKAQTHGAWHKTRVENISWVPDKESALGCPPHPPLQAPSFCFELQVPFGVPGGCSVSGYKSWLTSTGNSLALTALLKATNPLPNKHACSRLCFIFQHIVLTTIWHTICFTYSSVYCIFSSPGS